MSSRLLDNLLLFGRLLRRAGVDVHPGRLLDLVEALGHVDLASRDDVYHTCRTLLVHRQDQIALFDRAFAAFWRIHTEGTAAGPKRRDVVMDDRQRSSLEIPDDEIDIPEFLKD